MSTPTAAEFKARFPAFAAVADGPINYALGRAALKVGENWTPGDVQEGIFLYAAHLLTLDGFGAGAESQGYADGTAGFKSVSSGSLSLTRFDRGVGDSGSGLRSTTYGQRFADLQDLNIATGARAGGQ